MAGVRTVSLSVPVRYTHSAACVAMYKDYLAFLNLCQAVICGLKP
jgi:putative aminopeptidase FrvX